MFSFNIQLFILAGAVLIQCCSANEAFTSLKTSSGRSAYLNAASQSSSLMDGSGSFSESNFSASESESSSSSTNILSTGSGIAIQDSDYSESSSSISGSSSSISASNGGISQNESNFVSSSSSISDSDSTLISTPNGLISSSSNSISQSEMSSSSSTSISSGLLESNDLLDTISSESGSPFSGPQFGLPDSPFDSFPGSLSNLPGSSSPLSSPSGPLGPLSGSPSSRSLGSSDIDSILNSPLPSPLNIPGNKSPLGSLGSSPLSGSPLSPSPVSGIPGSKSPLGPLGSSPLSGSPFSSSPLSSIPGSNSPLGPLGPLGSSPFSGSPLSSSPLSGIPGIDSPSSFGPLGSSPFSPSPLGGSPFSDISEIDSLTSMDIENISESESSYQSGPQSSPTGSIIDSILDTNGDNFISPEEILQSTRPSTTSSSITESLSESLSESLTDSLTSGGSSPLLPGTPKPFYPGSGNGNKPILPGAPGSPSGPLSPGSPLGPYPEKPYPSYLGGTILPNPLRPSPYPSYPSPYPGSSSPYPALPSPYPGSPYPGSPYPGSPYPGSPYPGSPFPFPGNKPYPKPGNPHILPYPYPLGPNQPGYSHILPYPYPLESDTTISDIMSSDSITSSGKPSSLYPSPSGLSPFSGLSPNSVSPLSPLGPGSKPFSSIPGISSGSSPLGPKSSSPIPSPFGPHGVPPSLSPSSPSPLGPSSSPIPSPFGPHGTPPSISGPSSSSPSPLGPSSSPIPSPFGPHGAPPSTSGPRSISPSSPSSVGPSSSPISSPLGPHGAPPSISGPHGVSPSYPSPLGPGSSPLSPSPYGPGSLPLSPSPYKPGSSPLYPSPYGPGSSPYGPSSSPLSPFPLGPGSSPLSPLPYGPGSSPLSPSPYGPSSSPLSPSPHGPSSSPSSPSPLGPGSSPFSPSPYGPGSSPSSPSPLGPGSSPFLPSPYGPGSSPLSPSPFGPGSPYSSPYDFTPEDYIYDSIFESLREQYEINRLNYITSNSIYPMDISNTIDTLSDTSLTFDYVLAGSGSGSLSALKPLLDTGKQVLLLERGYLPPYQSLSLYHRDSLLQTGFVRPITGTVPNSDIPITIYLPNVLGEETTYNYNIWDNGSRRKYNQWGKISSKWSWNQVINYFTGQDSILPDTSPITYTRQLPDTKSVDIVTQIFSAAGLYPTDYIPGSRPEGLTVLPRLEENGNNVILAKEIFESLIGYPNLQLALRTIPKNIIFDNNGRAIAINVITPSGAERTIGIQDELIIGSNPIDTVQLLYRSGLGPVDKLLQNNIPPQINLPALGKELQVLPTYLGLIYTFPSGTLLSKYESDWASIEYLFGQYQLPNALALHYYKAFMNIYESIESNIRINFRVYTRYMKDKLIHFVKQFYSMDETVQNYILNLAESCDLLFVTPTLIDVQSRGEIYVDNPWYLAEPIVDTGMYRSKRDMAVMQKAIKVLKSIGETEIFKAFGGDVVQVPVQQCGIPDSSPEYYKCSIRCLSSPLFHFSGGAVMGYDSMTSVVNENLLVHETQNVRLFCSSVIPYNTGTDSSAVSSMIGNYGANLLVQNYILY